MKSIIALLITCVSAHAHTSLDLKVGHQTALLGVDDAPPRLSWRMEGKEKGLAQTAYEILVATSAEKLTPETADLWASGQVKETGTVTPYAGKALPSSTSGKQNFPKRRLDPTRELD